MSSGIGVLLLSAVGGYWVLERAERHKGRLKQVGQLIGGFVIVVSVLGVVCRVWGLASGKTAFCPFDKTGYFCPLTSKTSSTQSPAPSTSK